jgi:hypothetical protein
MASLFETRISVCTTICYCVVYYKGTTFLLDPLLHKRKHNELCGFLNLENLSPQHELSRRTSPTEGAEGRSEEAPVKNRTRIPRAVRSRNTVLIWGAHALFI